MKVLFLVFLTLSTSAQPVYRFETYAGNGIHGFADGDRKTAMLRSPEGIAIDAQGNLYITEYHSSIVRKIDTSGQLSVLAGQVMKTGYADGKGIEGLIDRPHGLAVDKKGNIYFCDMKNHLIRIISPDGQMGTFAGKPGEAGTTEGPRLEARFNMPEGIAINTKDELFIVDTYNYTLRKIDKNGYVSTVAGLGGQAGYRDGKGSAARFNMPLGLTVDSQDNIYIVDANYDGKPAGNCVVRKVDTAGNVTTFAGIPGRAGHRDGFRSKAQFNRPVGIAAAPDGTLFVADTEADVIRMIDQKGRVWTVGGKYLQERSVEGVGSEAAFFDPQSLVVAPNGDLFIADTHNNRIVRGIRVK